MRPLAASAALLCILSGCATPQEDTVTVFAASSLTTTFTSLAAAYEQEHPGTRVQLSFAGSSDLVAQMEQGARADVLATADGTTMDRAVDKLGLTAVAFATNRMAIAVPAGNPASVTGVADLADPAVRTVVCAPQVPCGAATAIVERKAGIDIPAVSEETSVTGVLGKVAAGEADAGVVYRSDVTGPDAAVTGIEIPAARNAVNRYFIAATGPAGDDFIELVLSPTGRATLTAAGFGAP